MSKFKKEKTGPQQKKKQSQKSEVTMQAGQTDSRNNPNNAK